MFSGTKFHKLISTARVSLTSTTQITIHSLYSFTTITLRNYLGDPHFNYEPPNADTLKDPKFENQSKEDGEATAAANNNTRVLHLLQRIRNSQCQLAFARHFLRTKAITLKQFRSFLPPTTPKLTDTALNDTMFIENNDICAQFTAPSTEETQRQAEGVQEHQRRYRQALHTGPTVRISKCGATPKRQSSHIT